jgi:hypothetical protein
VRAFVDLKAPGFVRPRLDLSFLFFIVSRCRGLGCSLHWETKVACVCTKPAR